LKYAELLGYFGFRARVFCNPARQRVIAAWAPFKPALKS
jgi:hypothetical protein